MTNYIKVAGIEVTPETWPKGAEKILPQDVSLSVRYYGVNMKAVWDELAKPDGVRSEALGKLALPNDTIFMDLADNYIRSANYDVTLDGKLSMAPGTGTGRERLQGNIVVKARDYDKTVTFLQETAKSIPTMNRAAMVALMAKGLGKTDANGATIWDIGFQAGGKVTVNGQPMPF